MSTAPQVVEPMTEAEKNKVVLPEGAWSDEFALKIAKRDFEYAENYRQRSHDWRYRNADEIYLAWVQQKYWEGTKVPRSSLGIFVAMEQIESLLPKILSSIFSDPDIFEVDPRPGTTAEEARSVRELMLYQLEEINIREVLRLALKDAYIYGNGVVELGWKYQEIKRHRYTVNWVPIVRKMQNILLGSVPRVVGKRRVVSKEPYTEIINMPFARRVSIKDFYIDPNCPTPCVQDARYVNVRKFMTVDELLAYKDQPGFKIPDKAVLLAMSRRKNQSEADNSKKFPDEIRGIQQDPLDESTVDPAGQRIEVIAHTTKDRLVWMLNREHVAFNEMNPYGFINYFGFYYVDVPDRWHALGLTDVVDGEQRLIQAITNGRIDELALAIHPSTVMRQGLRVSPSQLRRRPGNTISTPNPETDIIREQVQNVTQQAFVEVSAAEQRVQKYTGITDLAVLGVPSSGGNSASRTATGVNTQAAASASRIQYLIENAEDTAFEPMLEAWHELNTRFLDPEQAIPLSQGIEINPLTVKNARVKFSMRASAKMQSRNLLLQVYPLVSQTLFAPEFMEVLARTYGMKVNVLEMGRMLMEFTGYRRRFGELFEKLTDEEKQMLNQPPPQEVLRDKMQQDRLASQERTADEKISADLLKLIGEKALPDANMGAESESEDSAA